MRPRSLLAVLAASTLMGTTLLLASPAQAEDGDGCTITDILPETAVIGVAGKRVPFEVHTDCDDQDVKFAVEGQSVGTSAHVAWFAACNYTMDEGPAIYDCDHDGSGVINPIGGRYSGFDYIEGNAIAGENTIYAYAFVDANHNGLDDDEPDCDIEECDGDPTDRDQDAGVITLLRKTVWAGTFNAGPEPRRKGQSLNLSGLLYTANWNTGSWDNSTATVKIQFRAPGGQYRTVKTVTAWDGQFDIPVKAVRSGYWRASYPGSDTVAASHSNSDYVKVNPARKATTVPDSTGEQIKKKKPKKYANCDAMHADYEHGIRKKGAHDVVRGATDPVPDSMIPVRTKLYKANATKDRDKDGVACEAW